MWVFTETGFVSAVADGANKHQLVVRSRDRRSLEPLAALEDDQIMTGAGSDYQHRLLCDRTTFGRWLVEQIDSIQYPNFKERVEEARGEHFADALLGVWSVMHDVTDDVESDNVTDPADDLPYLVWTRRDTGETDRFSADVAPSSLFAAFIDGLQDGPDAIELLGWEYLDEEDTWKGPWVVHAISPSGERFDIDAVADDRNWSAAELLRQHMRLRGLEPGAAAEGMTHVLLDTFLAMADDLDFVRPLGAPFDIRPLHTVHGPWAPRTEPWLFDEERRDPYEVTMEWYMTPRADEPGSHDALAEFMREHLLAAAQTHDIQVTHSLTPSERAETGPASLLDALHELERQGVTVEHVDADDSWEIEPGGIIVTLYLDLAFVASDEDEDDLETDGIATWVLNVPLPRARLDAVLAAMVAGKNPEQALESVTGRTKFAEQED